jgi:hypothetical protein
MRGKGRGARREERGERREERGGRSEEGGGRRIPSTGTGDAGIQSVKRYDSEEQSPSLRKLNDGRRIQEQ